MRGRWNWLVLASLMAFGVSTPRAVSPPVATPSARAPAVAALPQAKETFCSFIKGKGDGDGPWAGAPLIQGSTIRDAAALERLRTRPVIIYGAKLAGQRLDGMRLAGICFENSDLSHADFRGAVADGAAFERSDLTGAVMTGARLRRVRLENTKLNDVDASGADLTGARIEGGSFDHLVLRNATLRDFRMRCGLVISDADCGSSGKQGVDARGADMTRAMLDMYILDDWKLDGAKIDRTVVQFNQIRPFNAARLAGPVILASSGYDTGARVVLSASEWRQLNAKLWVDRPSFDCARAYTRVERSLCEPEQWRSEQDRRLDSLYSSALEEGRTTRREQRGWLATRNACGRETDKWALGGCISEAYDNRLKQLMDQGVAASWIHPREERLFLSSGLVPSAAFQRTALYERIFPVLVRTAMSTVYVRAIDRHSVRAGGEAMGGNGHMCGLSTGTYRLDRKSGWFGALRSANYLQYFSVKPFEGVLKFAGDTAQVGPDDTEHADGEYVMCGVRAGFDTLRSVRVPLRHRGFVAKLSRNLLSSGS